MNKEDCGLSHKSLKNLAFFVHTIKCKQKPAEWSEEDEKNMATMIEILNLYQRFYDGGIITSIDDRRGFLKRMIELSNWLKSLRPHSHWKPTEEQMEALKFAIDKWENGQGVACPSSFRYENISQLYNALKKLIKEG